MSAARAAALALACALGLGLAFSPARADDAVPGHVILARASQNALVIWDATPEIAAITSAKMSANDANAKLEHDALRALAPEMRSIAKATTITLRVIYSKTGDVSPVYNTPTFAGIERYAELKLDGPSAGADKDKWQHLAADAKIPAWISFTVVGALPPGS